MPVSDTSMRQERRAVRRTRARHPQEHVALVREFHGIADEIHDDLTQAHGIAAREHRHLGIDVDHELDALDRGLQGARGGRVVDHVAQVEFHVLELEVPGVDLGDVEHIVDQGEERLGAAPR